MIGDSEDKLGLLRLKNGQIQESKQRDTITINC